MDKDIMDAQRRYNALVSDWLQMPIPARKPSLWRRLRYRLEDMRDYLLNIWSAIKGQ